MREVKTGEFSPPDAVRGGEPCAEPAADVLQVLRHRGAGVLRPVHAHQLYHLPVGQLTCRVAGVIRKVGPGEVFWARRGVVHQVQADADRTVYRVLLPDEPAALAGCNSAVAGLSAVAAALVRALGEARLPAGHGPRRTGLILAGIGAVRPDPAGSGYAVQVARALSRDPADPTGLPEWARRLHISTKTLQRDFIREFGVPYSRWRTRARLTAARRLLGQAPVAEVAARVGYASPSAFIAAFAREFGTTPGRI